MEVLDLLNPKALLIAALIFIPFERLTALRKDQKVLRKQWLNDAITFMVNKVLINVALIATFGLFLGSLSGLVPEGATEFILSQPLWLQVIEIIVISDTCYYLTHRAFHEVPVLWKFHSIHHSVEEMDWLAAYRIHPLDQTAAKIASLLPIFVLGFSGAAILVYAFIFQWQTLLIHSNTRLNFGPLRWILASPQFHHWHHANKPEAYNTNYAAQLPLIDLVFGTLHLPGRELPDRYGVDDEIPAYYHQQFVYPFIRKSEDAPVLTEALMGEKVETGNGKTGKHGRSASPDRDLRILRNQGIPYSRADVDQPVAGRDLAAGCHHPGG